MTSIPLRRYARAVVGTLTLAALGVSGCGGNQGHSGTYSVSGIVVSYPATLTRTVTLSDLTPVGAGIPIGIAEESGLAFDSSEYYKSHALPETDSNGRFTIEVDDSIPATDTTQSGVTGEILVQNRCSTTAIAYPPGQGSVDGSAGNTSGSIPGLGIATSPDHFPDDQLVSAGILAQGHFGADIVIVVSSNPDTCQDVSVPWDTGMHW